MSTVPSDTKPATVVMTFTVTKTLPANPKIGDLEIIRKEANEVVRLISSISGEITGHVIIGKQKFEL